MVKLWDTIVSRGSNEMNTTYKKVEKTTIALSVGAFVVYFVVAILGASNIQLFHLLPQQRDSLFVAVKFFSVLMIGIGIGAALVSRP
jgi:hypothetical protein